MPDPSAHLIGSSDTFRAFLADLVAVAASDAGVLLQGESGTGKGLAARALHAASPRAAQRFAVVNLAAVAPTLIEGALFGHERGAFTGADRARTGLFRSAEGGSVVLDDIDLLPREAQVKLLRVLQERVVEPLGSEEAVPVDVRVIATTNRDLRREVDAGRFREDLYFRLAVVTLDVPPLRARRDDVPELALALAARVAARVCREPRPLAPDALARLCAHPWPGNVRELENALERVHVLGPTTQGAQGAQGAQGGQEPQGAGPPAQAIPPIPIRAEELDFLDEAVAGAAQDLARAALAGGLSIDDVALAMMEAALAEERGNVSAAARRVGLTRRAFDYRMARRPDAAASTGSADA